MKDEIRELSLQLVLPLMAYQMDGQCVSKARLEEIGLDVLTQIKDKQFYQYLDTKKSIKHYEKYLEKDLTKISDACIKLLINMYFLTPNEDGYDISEATSQSWLSAKGMGLLYRYDDLCLTPFTEALDESHLVMAKNFIEMIGKDKKIHRIDEVIDLIQKIVTLDPKAYQLRLTGLEMIKKADVDDLAYCQLSNKMAYGLLAVHDEKMLKFAKGIFDELKRKVEDLDEDNEVLSLKAKILSNLGAYYQSRFKLYKNYEDIAEAVFYHKEALDMRLALESPALSNSYLTLASDYFHAYNESHDLNHLKTSLDYHEQAYDHLPNKEEGYKNLTRIAGVKIQLCFEDFDEEMVSSLYDDLTKAQVLAYAKADRKEIINIKENFKESLDLFNEHPCPSRLYNKIYALARNLDTENGYLEDLVKKRI